MDIRFADCSVRFGDKTALYPLSLHLTEKRIGIIGLNGSGKTTFARLVNGLVKPSQGHVSIDGLDTVADEKSVFGKAGFIFQNPQHQLIMPIVEEDIAFGLKNRGLKAAEISERTAAILARFGISHLARRRVHELSGGETQLVAMASVVVTDPNILILDEPTNQLDLKNRALVLRTIESLEQQVLVISHDLSLITDFERVILFNGGQLVADGAPAAVIARYREIAEC